MFCVRADREGTKVAEPGADCSSSLHARRAAMLANYQTEKMSPLRHLEQRHKNIYLGRV